MREQWRIRIKGEQYKEVDIDLLLQAVLALGEQLAREQQAEEAEDTAGMEEPPRD